jgi:hypothetical protein
MPVAALVLIGLGVAAAIEAIRSSGAGSSISASIVYPRLTTDPGVDASHAIGALPCPTNPPPPPGMVYWTNQAAVTQDISAWAVQQLNTQPMGTIVEDLVDGTPVAGRIEWHTVQGATGLTGCFKGFSLLLYTDGPSPNPPYSSSDQSGGVAFIQVPRGFGLPRRSAAHTGHLLRDRSGVGALGMPEIRGPSGLGLPIWGRWGAPTVPLAYRRRIRLPARWPPY